MRIDVEQRQVVCISEDWKNLTAQERKFFSQCYWHAIWTGLTENGNLLMRKCSTAYDQVRLIEQAKTLAKSFQIEVTPAVDELIREYQFDAETEKIRREKEREVELRRAQWQRRQERGCEGCAQCEQVGDAWFRCKYSGDNLDCRFSEVWNAVHKCMDIFHEIGVPNEHCRDYFGDRIQKSGGMKEWENLKKFTRST